MKKIRNLILTAAMMLSIVPIIKNNTITANAAQSYNYYQWGCDAYSYEVDNIDDNGNFVKANCYNDFSSAKADMGSYHDGIVRAKSSYSANQIIAMTRGYAYSYAQRDNSSILVINQNTTENYAKSTYISNYRGMYYEDTISYDGDGTGTVLVNAYGFEGNVELKDVDLIPAKFVDRGIAIWIGGNDATSSPESPWQLAAQRSYYSVQQNGSYTDLMYHLFSSKVVSDNSTQAYDITGGGMAVGPAASWMTVGSVYYSLNDTDFYADPDMKTYVNQYYNYYQFVSLRSQSKISSDAYNGFITKNGYPSSSVLWNSGSTFVDDQTTYGINAAMAFAQACVESAFGTSNFALTRYNLFGVNAYDSNTNNASYYASVKASIDNQMGLLLRQYSDTKQDRGVFFGGHFGNKGSGITVKYASSPYYGLTLASYYYAFDKYASGNDGKLTDWQSTCLGIVKNSDTTIYSNEDGTGEMFTTAYGPTYQMNFTVSILEDDGDYYKVQSTDYVKDGATMVMSSGTYVTYDWDSMVGYIKKSDVTTVIGTAPAKKTVVQTQDMLRLYNPFSGEHLYTSSVEEKDNLVSLGWHYEGVGWTAPVTSNTPVYRLYNPYSGDHHYTTNAEERDYLTTLGWRYEGVGWYSDDNQGVPLYRQFNPNETIGTHNYTKDKAENDYLVSLGWRAEGVGWYGVK